MSDELAFIKGVGQRVRRLRRAQGFSLAAFARATDLRELEIVTIEEGRADPNLGDLYTIAKVLKMNLSQLVAVRGR